MSTTQQPDALTALRERLRSFETDHQPDGWPAVRMRDISALLDDLDNARSDNHVLRLGYAAARLEIESLRARSAQPAGEYPLLPEPVGKVEVSTTLENSGLRRRQTFPAHTSDQMRAYVDADRAMRAAQPAGAQQPGDERAAFEQWSKVTNQGYDLARNVSGKLQTFESTETEHAWRGFFHGLRASHGQAPAQAAPAAVETDPCPGCIPGGYCRTPKCGRLIVMNAAKNAAPAAVAWPVAVLKFERGTPGRENEMPRVVSCNWMPDGEYEVYLAAAPTTQPAPQPAPQQAPQPSPAAQGDALALLVEARSALWQPANVDLCERIDTAIDAARAAQEGK